MLENPSQHETAEARASLVLPRGREGLEIWMGGAHTARGERIDGAHVATALLIDCAGDLPAELTAAALQFQPFVFLDIEERPAAFDRIRKLAADVASARDQAPAVERITILCTHGMNRSGLVAGLVLRAMGHSADEAIAMIRAARPGALSNRTFVSLLAED